MESIINIATKFNGKKKYIGINNHIVKGKRFKDVPVFKMLSSSSSHNLEKPNAVAYSNVTYTGMGYAYTLGLNVDTKPLCYYPDNNGAGLYFATVDYIEQYMFNYGEMLAVLRIPEDEDVLLKSNRCRTHSIILDDVLPLKDNTTWELLLSRGYRLKDKSVSMARYIIMNNIVCMLPHIKFSDFNYNNLEYLYDIATKNGNAMAEDIIRNKLGYEPTQACTNILY